MYKIVLSCNQTAISSDVQMTNDTQTHGCNNTAKQAAMSKQCVQKIFSYQSITESAGQATKTINWF